jgi:putative flippase GtrA
MRLVLRFVPPALRPLVATDAFAQLARYVIGGLAVTFFSVCVYSLFAVPLHVAPLVANALSYAAGLAAGYAVHSRWSFRARTEGEEAAMVLRFLAASAIAFALNSFWVWLATGLLRLPPLAPVPAMLFATPLASFVLNRCWVFRARSPR